MTVPFDDPYEQSYPPALWKPAPAATKTTGGTGTQPAADTPVDTDDDDEVEVVEDDE